MMTTKLTLAFVLMLATIAFAQNNNGDRQQRDRGHHYMQCVFPNGSVVLLYMPDFANIKAAQEACYAMGGSPKGYR